MFPVFLFLSHWHWHTQTHTLLYILSLFLVHTLFLSLSLSLAQHTQTECISTEGSREDNEVKILDNEVVISTTSDVDNSNTIDADDADDTNE